MITALSRRSLVTAAAALPTLAVPALAVVGTEPDPIHAAIERWKEALAVENAAFEARDKAIHSGTAAFFRMP
jgi:hypothetical protein